MSGDMLFEAMTDIDDELVTKAAGYRPRKVIPIRLISGAAAAVLILAVGLHAFMPVSKDETIQNNAADLAGAMTDMAEAEKIMLQEAGSECPAKSSAAGMDYAAPSDQKANGPAAAAEAIDAAEAEAVCIHIVGWIEDYAICIENISEEEYLLYLCKSDEKVSLEESALTKEQKETVLKMVKEYRSQK